MREEKQLEGLHEKFEKEKLELLSVGIFRKGSITKRWMTCGNPSCRCKTDKQKRHGPYYWWTTKEKAKTKAILVPKEFLSEARSYLRNYKKFQKKIRSLSQLSDQIIRKKVEIYKKTLKDNP